MYVANIVLAELYNNTTIIGLDFDLDLEGQVGFGRFGLVWKVWMGLKGQDGVTTICVKLQLLMSYSVHNSLLFYDYKPLNLLLVKTSWG